MEMASIDEADGNTFLLEDEIRLSFSDASMELILEM
jgi:hypothetical protein